METATQKLSEWRQRPDIFVREVFGVTPDPWQEEVLKAFPLNQRVALMACKGPGKTCVLAWLAWNFLVTRPHPVIAATSITADNLADNLWTEMARWMGKSEMIKAGFTWQKTKIFANDHPETWFMTARPWPRSADAAQQGNTLAGLHADYIMFILDESGDIPDAVAVAADAALSSCVEGHILQAGNPTRLEGPLYRACTKDRKIWYVKEITGDPDDPMRAPRVSIEWAKQQIESYGRDNPWVLVNVFGKFPPSSFNSLITPDEVAQAMNRYYRPQEYNNAAKVMGIDVARGGLDSSVLFVRQGLQAFQPNQYRNINGTQGADIVARRWQEELFDAVFVDDTGGFGSSWIDNLNRLGFTPIGIHFAEKSANTRYANKRTEMMFECVEWIKKGGAIPNIPELAASLTQTTYTFDKAGSGDRLIIEPKDMIKEKLGYSPDHLDSLMLTFASPVMKTANVAVGMGHSRHQTGYDSLSLDHVRKDVGGTSGGGYDPLSVDFYKRN